MARAMRELDGLLKQKGEAVYTTRPWVRFGEPIGAPVREAALAEGVHVHALDPASGEVILPDEFSARTARCADGSDAQSVSRADSAVVLTIPDVLRRAHAAVATVS